MEQQVAPIPKGTGSGENQPSEGSQQTLKAGLPEGRRDNVGRLVGVIQDRQKEIAGLKDRLAELEKSQLKQSGSQTGDLQGDAEGMYELHGTRVPVDFAKDYLGLVQNVDKLTKAVQDSQTAGEEQRHMRDLDQARGDLSREIYGSISEVRSKMLEGIKDEHASEVDGYIFEQADKIMGDKLEKGESFGTDLINASIAEAFQKADRLFNVFGAQQVLHNTEFGDKYKNTDGALSAVTAEDMRKMSPRVRENYMRKAAALADERTRAGQ